MIKNHEKSLKMMKNYEKSDKNHEKRVKKRSKKRDFPVDRGFYLVLVKKGHF